MTAIRGCTAIVTGGASGIGRGSALALAGAGARLVVTDLDAGGAERVAAEIRAAGGEAVGAACDVGRDGQFEPVRELALQRFGRVDIVMNNAGVILSGLPEDIPVSEWERVMSVNFLSVVRSNAVFLPLLLEQGSGHIVNTASFAGLYSYAYDRLPYAASKAAIFQMSEGLALYLRPKGIGVTVLCPGPVATNIMRSTRVWTDGIALRGPGPEFGLMSADAVGALVVDAIGRDLFFLPTDPQVTARLVTRAQDVDAHLEAQIAHPHRLELPPLRRTAETPR